MGKRVPGLDALQVFHHVARLGGIGAAARYLGLTQPAVSQRLAKLERTLGRRLHGRAGRRMVLTEEGKTLQTACAHAVEALESSASLLNGEDAPLTGVVRVAALSEIGKVHLLPLIRRFRGLHSGVEFDVFYKLPHEIHYALARHEADVVVTNELVRRSYVEAIRLMREEIVCVGPAPARRLAARDLAGLPWISYGSDDPLWAEFEAAAERAGVALPRPVLRIADIESVMRLVADGSGYALVPGHALALRPLKGVAKHALPLPPLRKEVHACRLKTAPPSRAAQAFWELLTGRAARGPR